MNQLWERRDCVSAEVDQSLVLLDLDTLVYHSLNQSARSIWEQLAEPATADRIVASLCATYDVPLDQCHAAVARVLEEMAHKGLVKQAGAATAA